MKFLTALLIAILTLLIGTFAFISMYAGVPEFREMVEYGISLIAPEKKAPAEADAGSSSAPAAKTVAPVSPAAPAADSERIADETAAAASSESTEPTPADTQIDASTGVPEVGQVIERPADDVVTPAPADALSVPDGLSEKAGLDPIKEIAETVPDEKADEIEQTLSTGPTGDDLTFDSLYYPYYSMISDKAKQLYRQIYANTEQKNPSFRAVDRTISYSDIQNAYVAVYYDHPELYWLDRSFYTFYRRNGDFLEIDIVYNGTEKDESRFQSAAGSLMLSTAEGGTDYDREKLAHDLLAEMDTYSLSAPLNQSAYSAVVNKSTVCAGYARALQYLMIQNRIPCYLCTGYAGEAHAWNIICLDGEYYNVDVTWDDTDDLQVKTYDWFNLTDQEFASTHMRQGLSVNLPPCNGQKYGHLEENPQVDNDEVLAPYGLTSEDIIHDADTFFSRLDSEVRSRGRGEQLFYMALDAELCSSLFNDSGEAYIDENIMKPIMRDAGSTQLAYTLEPQTRTGNVVPILCRVSLN